MSKLQNLRAAVLAASPKLEADQLFTFVREGKVTDTGAGIRYEGTVTVIVTEWPESAHPITRALAQWLRTQENASFDALTFEVDLIDSRMVDISYTLPFSENVVFDGSEFAECAAGVPDPDSFLPR